MSYLILRRAEPLQARVTKMKKEKITTYLPSVFQRTVGPGNAITAVLGVMESLHDPTERTLANVDRYFDPRRAPDEFIPFLARWVDLERIFNSSGSLQQGSNAAPDIGRLRELISEAVHLSRWRGTKKGLLLFLRTATGEQGFEIDERVKGSDGQPMPFHMIIRVPQTSQSRIDLIRRIVESEKPAHLTYAIEFF